MPHNQRIDSKNVLYLHIGALHRGTIIQSKKQKQNNPQNKNNNRILKVTFKWVELEKTF